MQNKCLSIENLHVVIRAKKAKLVPVEDVSLSLPAGSIVGVVGESGCGKSMTARAIMGLLPIGGRVESGRVMLNGVEISAYTPKMMRTINGNRISMIFQEPMSSLNPVQKVGKQIEETLILHTKLSKAERYEKVIDIMRKVGIPEPEKRYHSYPFELSGGLRQRVMIAMAMILTPEILIADEPTTALDVTIEAQILRLMKQLRDDFGTSILMITHNLGVVAKICDSVNVMYMGQVVESCDTVSLFDKPLHPYTKGLMGSVPRVEDKSGRLHNIPGSVPTLYNVPKGCRFADRCAYACDQCREGMPPLEDVGGGHMVRCFRVREVNEN